MNMYTDCLDFRVILLCTLADKKDNFNIETQRRTLAQTLATLRVTLEFIFLCFGCFQLPFFILLWPPSMMLI